MTKTSRKARPTAKGALIEVLLVLALAVAVVGAVRSWLAHATPAVSDKGP